MDGAYANLSSHEGNIIGSEEIQLDFRVRRISITNDSSSLDLKFKFHSSKEYSTLKPTEQISMVIRTRQVFLQGTGVDYRIWGTG